MLCNKMMNDMQKRFALFLFGCIGVRSLFVYIAKTSNVQYLPYLGNTGISKKTTIIVNIVLKCIV